MTKMNLNILQLGAPELKALDRIRAQLAEVGAQIEDTAGAHWPHDVILARMMGLARDQLSTVDYTMRAFAEPGAFKYPEPRNFVGFVAWLLGEKEFETRLRARIREMAPSPGLAKEQRDAQLAKLRAKETELHEAEEREISRLEAQGHVVARRADADIAVLLKVWEDAA
jgi:hypothetical protein